MVGVQVGVLRTRGLKHQGSNILADFPNGETSQVRRGIDHCSLRKVLSCADLGAEFASFLFPHVAFVVKQNFFVFWRL